MAMASGRNQNQPVIRLFLVRHGETLANRKCFVVGQSHSVRIEKVVRFVRPTKSLRLEPVLVYCVWMGSQINVGGTKQRVMRARWYASTLLLLA
jgi:hypothetical protein